MDFQDAFLICLNGHPINSCYYRQSDDNKAYCDECGSNTIYTCQHCQAEIRGFKWLEGVIYFSEPGVPQRCPSCGKPYPWTEKKLAEVEEAKLAKSPAFADLAVANSVEMVEHLFRRFHAVARQLRSRHANRQGWEINDEYDVQDLFYGLLRIYFDDIRAEEWTPSYAGASSRIDFWLKTEGIIIELKKTRPSLKDKTLGEQLSVDIKRYENYPNYQTLMCLVYDPDCLIQNPRGLVNDLSAPQNQIKVKTIIVSY